MTKGLSIPQAGARLDEIVREARASSDPVLLTDGDTPVAAVVGIETLRELQRLQDEADIAICLRSEADPAPRLTHEEFMAALEAEDAAAS